VQLAHLVRLGQPEQLVQPEEPEQLEQEQLVLLVPLESKVHKDLLVFKGRKAQLVQQVKLE
jgi:hypothetical protein